MKIDIARLVESGHQSEDPDPTKPERSRKEVKAKIVEDKK